MHDREQGGRAERKVLRVPPDLPVLDAKWHILASIGGLGDLGGGGG